MLHGAGIHDHGREFSECVETAAFQINLQHVAVRLSQQPSIWRVSINLMTTCRWQVYLQNMPSDFGRTVLYSQGGHWSGSTYNQTNKRHTPKMSTETEQIDLH